MSLGPTTRAPTTIASVTSNRRMGMMRDMLCWLSPRRRLDHLFEHPPHHRPPRAARFDDAGQRDRRHVADAGAVSQPHEDRRRLDYARLIEQQRLPEIDDRRVRNAQPGAP